MDTRKALTPQQKRFVRYFVETRKVGESAIRAGFQNPKYGTNLLQKPAVQTAIQRALARAGIDDRVIAQKVKEGLDATLRAEFYREGGTKAAEAPDFHVRKEYLDVVFKLKGDYAPIRSENVEKKLTINVNLDMLKGLEESGVLDAEEIQEIRELEGETTPKLLKEKD